MEELKVKFGVMTSIKSMMLRKPILQKALVSSNVKIVRKFYNHFDPQEANDARIYFQQACSAGSARRGKVPVRSKQRICEPQSVRYQKEKP